MADPSKPWRHCSTCKTPIALGAAYTVCSVSTCNRARIGLVFCSMDCWDAHLPGARHREAFAEEKTAPRSHDEPPPKRQAAAEGKRKVVPSRRRDPGLPRDTLIVASKLKAYVRAASGFNTSDSVMETLSDKVRDVTDRALERARADGRKTLLDRDFLP